MFVREAEMVWKALDSAAFHGPHCASICTMQAELGEARNVANHWCGVSTN
jgi:hypothetical protein